MFIQEQSLGIHYNQGKDLFDYVTDPSIYNYKDGYLNIMTGPGLGLDINEEAVIEATKILHNWKNPVWRNYDGTVAEW